MGRCRGLPPQREIITGVIIFAAWACVLWVRSPRSDCLTCKHGVKPGGSSRQLSLGNWNLDSRSASERSELGRVQPLLSVRATQRCHVKVLRSSCLRRMPRSTSAGRLVMTRVTSQTWSAQKKEPAQCGLQMNLMDGSGRNRLLCSFRGRFRRSCLCSLCLVLRGEFLLHLGCDGFHVHLVELGSFPQSFAGFIG